MAELDEGRKWYVVATILGADTFGLPELTLCRREC